MRAKTRVDKRITYRPKQHLAKYIESRVSLEKKSQVEIIDEALELLITLKNLDVVISEIQELKNEVVSSKARNDELYSMMRTIYLKNGE